jgi:hypothetical protein
MKRYMIILLSALAMGSCKKYEQAPLLSHPAYMRVFSDLAFSIDPLHNGQSTPFLTFIMDPHEDAGGVADTGLVVGDYLTTRQGFSLSYPINEANSSTGTISIDPQSGAATPYINPLNFEYPGNAHVLTAPAINGFDLSAWAQVPSGKHRIVFVDRPQNATPFSKLSAAIRNQIIVDTTVNFEEGEVYTLEVVARDPDNGGYGLYMRKEAFIHQSFEENKLYAGFVNLSGFTPKSSQYKFNKVFSDKIAVNYTYEIYDDIYNAFRPNDIRYNALDGYNNNYYTTLQTTMDTAVPYLALPLLPAENFFALDTLRPYGITAFYNQNDQGALPFVAFNFNDAHNTGTNFRLNCSTNPYTFNNYHIPFYDPTNLQLPNLNLIVNTAGSYHIYSTLNILELVYDRVYLMQVQRAFNEVPKN